MAVKIRLEIHEIVHDFERVVGYEEMIRTFDDLGRLTDRDSAHFLKDMEKMTEKYLPSYRNHLEEEGWSDDDTDKMKAMILSDLLKRNFRHIFASLV